MSTLKKIRENVGLVIILIALSLFAFIFVDLFQNINTGSSRTTVAEVFGSDIDYDQLSLKSDMLDRTNPSDGDIALQYQRREDAWQSLIREALYRHEWDNAGITITDQELMMMFQGQIFHPYVAQSGYFNDSLGQYNPGMVPLVFERADDIAENPGNYNGDWQRWRQGLVDLRAILRLDRQSTKWQRMISGGMLVADNEFQYDYNNQQRSVNISYVSVPYSSITDDQITVSESDYVAYYNKVKEKFKREEEAQIKYAYFPINPSNEDSATTRINLGKLTRDFNEAEDPFQFAFSNSDSKNLDTTYKSVDQLPKEVTPYLSGNDTVVGPVLGAEGFVLYRIAGSQEDSNAVLKLRHILVKVAGTTAADTAEARDKARQIRNEVTSATFAATAAEKSDDGSKVNGGDLGWMPPSAYGPKFAEALEGRQPGSIVFAESSQGFHVVEVLDRSTTKYRVASITREVIASTATSDSVFKRASQYHGEVIGGADMDAALANYGEGQTNTSPVMSLSEYTLLGVTGGREVITWAFSNEPGTINDEIIEAENAFVIASVIYRGNKGYKSVDDVRAEIEVPVRNRVKAKMIREKLAAAANGADMNAIASAYGAGATAGTAANVRFSTNFVQNIGNEPKVVGRAFGLQQGQVSGPISGNNGVYIIKVDAINEATAASDAIRQAQKLQATQTKASQAITASFQGLRDLGEIIDYRAKFNF